jgi:hypothetical protein
MPDTSSSPGRPAAARDGPPSLDQGDQTARPIPSGRPRRPGSNRPGTPGIARAVRGTRWRDIEWVEFSSVRDAGGEIEHMTARGAESETASASPEASDKFAEILRKLAQPAAVSSRVGVPGLASRFARVPVPRPVAERAAPAGLVSVLAKLAASPPPAAIDPPPSTPALAVEAEEPRLPEPDPVPVPEAAPEPSEGSANGAAAPKASEGDFPASFLTPVGSTAESSPPIGQTFGAQLGQAGAAVSASLVRVRTTLRDRWPAPALAQLGQAGATLRRQRESVGIVLGEHLVRARAALRTRLPTPSPPKAEPEPVAIPEAPPRVTPPAAAVHAPPPPRIEPWADAAIPAEPEPAPTPRAVILGGHVHATALRLAGGDPERLRRWLTVTGTAIVVAVVAYAVGAMIAGLASSDSRRHAAASHPTPTTASSVPVPNIRPAAAQSLPPPAPAATPPSEPVARAAFYLARAKAGDAAAQYDIGVLYAQGSGLVQDYASAASWFHAAAAQGIVDAQYNLGVLYERGLGVAANPIDAVNWYRSAADQNNAAAQYNLAIAYTEGRGTEQDLAAAARWYKRAAQRGLALAMFNLAIFYERGQGVDRSPVDAYAWYAAAAERGYAAAKQRAGELLAQFSDQDKAKAQGLAATIAASINGAPPA